LQSKLCNYKKSPLYSPFYKGGNEDGDLKARLKPCPTEKST